MSQGRGVKFLLDNYVSRDILANYYVSSEQAAFPVENAFNQNRRSKVWRSNGYFNITALNNVLIIRETTGVDLTVTVPVAEYNTTTSFLTALKNALDLAGASTYTVTQNSDKKIVLTSNGLGGGGLFQIRGADPLSTLVSVIGFAASNTYTGALTYTADLIRINTSEWIVWDTGIASKPNAFAMTAAKSTGLKFSPSSSITLKGSPTNPLLWTTPPVEIDLEFDDEVIAHITEEDFSDVGCRFWRLELNDVDNAYGYLEVGAFFLGKWWAPSDSCAIFPFGLNRQDRSETLISEGGQTFSARKPKYREFSISYNELNKLDVEDLDFWWEKYGTSTPFFISADTNENFSSMFQRKIIYGKFAGAPLSTELYDVNVWQSRMLLREEL